MASRGSLARAPGDYTNVGVRGRRTGVTYSQRNLDENGMETVLGIFSSPKKPSPLKQAILADSDATEGKSRGRDTLFSPPCPLRLLE